jgi:hypothetical protein
MLMKAFRYMGIVYPPETAYTTPRIALNIAKVAMSGVSQRIAGRSWNPCSEKC